MPCPRCGNKVTMSTVTHNIWFCKCGLCNVCHPSGIYWNHDQYGVPRWYQRSRTPGSIKPFVLGSSHGGHGWTPDLNLVHPFLQRDISGKLNTSESSMINLLIQKQNHYLPKALKELQLNQRKSSHWAWWAFPTNRPGRSEPHPKTCLTMSAAGSYLIKPPLIWKHLLEEVILIIKTKKKRVSDIFPSADYGRIKEFIIFFRQVIHHQQQKSKWLSIILDQLETNF